MKLKKLLMTALVIFALVYGFIIGKGLYDDHQYKLALQTIDGYLPNNETDYVNYHKLYKDAPNEDVIFIVNNGLNDFEYSETLVEIINDENTDLNKISDYLKYLSNNPSYDVHQTVLIINNYFDKLSNIDLNELLKFADEKYYINKNIIRYIDYYQNNIDLTYREVIEAVNCNRDRDYYTETISTNVDVGLLILVNKYYYLSSDYIPNDLVYFDSKYVYGSGQPQLVQEAYDAFIEMHNDALIDNYDIMISSINAFRDYQQQEKTYKHYEDAYGTAGADTCSARPGYSEHQTGLTIDTTCFKADGTSFDTFEEEYRWLRNNSWKYGFIYRYQGEEEFYTGYEEEQWHYRYVGKEIAQYIHDSGITFDEYYEYFVKDNSITESEFVSMFN